MSSNRKEKVKDASKKLGYTLLESMFPFDVVVALNADRYYRWKHQGASSLQQHPEQILTLDTAELEEASNQLEEQITEESQRDAPRAEHISRLRKLREGLRRILDSRKTGAPPFNTDSTEALLSGPSDPHTTRNDTDGDGDRSTRTRD